MTKIKPTLKKSQLVAQTGIPAETIRYYENVGLLTPPTRDLNGYRLFNDSHLQELHFIKTCRELGFGIDDIKQLKALQQAQNPHQADTLIQYHLQQINTKIQQLHAIKQTLLSIADCQGDDDSCKVVDYLMGKPHTQEKTL